jgi:glucose-1-phosphate thymidylyltransferase
VKGPARTPDLVGLVPAAGSASRIAPLPCSKELFPIGFGPVAGDTGPRPKPVASYLLERMAAAGVRKAFVVLRDGKWDIPSYFGGGDRIGLDLAYLVVRKSFGVPFTIDHAYPFLKDSAVAFGFPDILYWPEDALGSLVRRRESSAAEIVVGVVPTRRPEKEDLVELDERGQITAIEIKRESSDLRHTWMLAVWGPAFTEFMHAFVADVEPEVSASQGLWRGRELYAGDVLWAALQNGLTHETVVFEEGGYIDIGTPDELSRAVRAYAGSSTEQEPRLRPGKDPR